VLGLAGLGPPDTLEDNLIDPKVPAFLARNAENGLLPQARRGVTMGFCSLFPRLSYFRWLRSYGFSHFCSNKKQMTKSTPRMTVPRFRSLKAEGRKITMLTAYDHAMARLLDAVGIEGILVGDSMSMVVQGHANTLPVTLDEMIYHAEMVGRAVQHALVVVDMPFPSYHLGTHKAIENAGRILKQTRCQAVKLEGGADQSEVIAALTAAGIPVMAHCGLRPQNIHQLGDYKVHRDEEALLSDAQAAEAAGAFSIVLECVPAGVAKRITEVVNIPTIGIGAGPACDGQVLVINDLLGMATDYAPRFVKAYADLKTTISEAVESFRDDVREGTFPDAEHVYE